MKITSFSYQLGETIPNPNQQFANRTPFVRIEGDVEEGETIEEALTQARSIVVAELNGCRDTLMAQWAEEGRMIAAAKARAQQTRPASNSHPVRRGDARQEPQRGRGEDDIPC